MDIKTDDYIVCEEEYSPCPDCYNQPELVENNGSYALVCTGCDRSTDWFQTSGEAIEAWDMDIANEYPDEVINNKNVQETVLRTIPIPPEWK